MSDIQTLIQRFTLQNLSVTQGDQVTPLIDGVNYFTAIKQEIDRLKAGNEENRFFYLAGWILDSAFKFPSSTDGAMLLSELYALHQKGVDVRVLVWVSPESNFWGRNSGGLIPYYNNPSLLFVKNMVNMGLRKNVVMNIMGHVMGAAHIKCVICGHADDVIAFVGGLDFASNRIASQGHAQNPWHDAAVQVRGPGALNVFHYYRQLWNHQLKQVVLDAVLWHDGLTPETELKSHVVGNNGTPEIEDPIRNTTSSGSYHVQVLRTFPNYGKAPELGKAFWRQAAHLSSINLYSSVPKRIQPGFTKHGEPGLFEYQEAIEKAIGTAEKYIYIEDQWFWGKDGLHYLNQRIKQKPELKVILIHGGDPADGSISKQLMVDGINNVLCAGLSSDQLKQIAFWNCSGTIHSKLVIIDDVWAVVGSNNFADRSFYTDIELGVAVLEDADPPFAQRLRAQLWAEHRGKTPTSAPSWEDEILMWSDWGSTSPTSRFQHFTVPFTKFTKRAKKSDAIAIRGDTLIEIFSWDIGGSGPQPQEIVGELLKITGDSHVYRITEVQKSAVPSYFKLRIEPPLQAKPSQNADFLIMPQGAEVWGVAEPDPTSDAYREDYDKYNFNSKEGL